MIYVRKGQITPFPVARIGEHTNPTQINAKPWYFTARDPALAPTHLDPLTHGSMKAPAGLGTTFADHQGAISPINRPTSHKGIYEARLNVTAVHDLDRPVAPHIRAAFASGTPTFLQQPGSPMHSALADKAATPRTLFHGFRNSIAEHSQETLSPTSEYAEHFADLGSHLKRAGVDGFSYQYPGDGEHMPTHRRLTLLDPNDYYADTGRTGQVASLQPITYRDMIHTQKAFAHAISPSPNGPVDPTIVTGGTDGIVSPQEVRGIGQHYNPTPSPHAGESHVGPGEWIATPPKEVSGRGARVAGDDSPVRDVPVDGTYTAADAHPSVHAGAHQPVAVMRAITANVLSELDRHDQGLVVEGLRRKMASDGRDYLYPWEVDQVHRILGKSFHVSVMPRRTRERDPLEARQAAERRRERAKQKRKLHHKAAEGIEEQESTLPVSDAITMSHENLADAEGAEGADSAAGYGETPTESTSPLVTKAYSNGAKATQSFGAVFPQFPTRATLAGNYAKTIRSPDIHPDSGMPRWHTGAPDDHTIMPIDRGNTVVHDFPLFNHLNEQVGLAGSMYQRYPSGRLDSYLANLQMRPQFQDNKIGGQFYGAQEDWLRKNKFDSASIMAAGTVGKYAWARHGYDFSHEDDAREHTEKYLKHLHRNGLHDLAAPIAAQYGKTGEPLHAWEIAMHGIDHPYRSTYNFPKDTNFRMPVHAGKEYLLGTDGWSGTKAFDGGIGDKIGRAYRQHLDAYRGEVKKGFGYHRDGETPDDRWLHPEVCDSYWDEHVGADLHRRFGVKSVKKGGDGDAPEAIHPRFFGLSSSVHGSVPRRVDHYLTHGIQLPSQRSKNEGFDFTSQMPFKVGRGSRPVTALHNYALMRPSDLNYFYHGGSHDRMLRGKGNASNGPHIFQSPMSFTHTEDEARALYAGFTPRDHAAAQVDNINVADGLGYRGVRVGLTDHLEFPRKQHTGVADPRDPGHQAVRGYLHTQWKSQLQPLADFDRQYPNGHPNEHSDADEPYEPEIMLPHAIPPERVHSPLSLMQRLGMVGSDGEVHNHHVTYADYHQALNEELKRKFGRTLAKGLGAVEPVVSIHVFHLPSNSVAHKSVDAPILVKAVTLPKNPLHALMKEKIPAVHVYRHRDKHAYGHRHVVPSGSPHGPHARQEFVDPAWRQDARGHVAFGSRDHVKHPRHSHTLLPVEREEHARHNHLMLHSLAHHARQTGQRSGDTNGFWDRLPTPEEVPFFPTEGHDMAEYEDAREIAHGAHQAAIHDKQHAHAAEGWRHYTQTVADHLMDKSGEHPEVTLIRRDLHRLAHIRREVTRLGSEAADRARHGVLPVPGVTFHLSLDRASLPPSQYTLLDHAEAQMAADAEAIGRVLLDQAPTDRKHDKQVEVARRAWLQLGKDFHAAIAARHAEPDGLPHADPLWNENATPNSGTPFFALSQADLAANIRRLIPERAWKETERAVKQTFGEYIRTTQKEMIAQVPRELADLSIMHYLDRLRPTLPLSLSHLRTLLVEGMITPQTRFDPSGISHSTLARAEEIGQLDKAVYLTDGPPALPTEALLIFPTHVLSVHGAVGIPSGALTLDREHHLDLMAQLYRPDRINRAFLHWQRGVLPAIKAEKWEMIVQPKFCWFSTQVTALPAHLSVAAASHLVLAPTIAPDLVQQIMHLVQTHAPGVTVLTGTYADATEETNR